MTDVNFETTVKAVAEQEIRVIRYSVYDNAKTIIGYEVFDMNLIEIRQALIKLGWIPPKQFCKVCGSGVSTKSNCYLNQNGELCYSVRCSDCGAFYIDKKEEK